MQLPDFRSVNGSGCRPTQPFPVLPRMGQASPSSLPQNLPFELSKDGQQASHGTPGWCGQIQCLSKGNESDAKMFQFLQGRQQIRYRAAPAVQPRRAIYSRIARLCIARVC